MILLPCLACDAGTGEADVEDGTEDAGKADGAGKADELDAFAEATAEVQAALEAAGEPEQFNYCQRDGTNADGTPSVASLKCRSVFLFEDPSMFRISFLNGAGLSGASEYAMQNDDGTYRLYVDPTLDGNPEVGEIVGENQDLDVRFDEEGLPTIEGMTIHLGPTTFLHADLSFASDAATLSGFIVEETCTQESDEPPRCTTSETELVLTYDRV